MKRLLLATIFTAGLAHSATFAAESAMPNILLIVSDDQSYPYLGCYGEPAVQTPNLNQLAAEGMKFRRMFVTSPQCSPSRCSFMTGRSPVASRTSRFGAPLPRTEVTFPELLRKNAGYFTGILGRIHHLDGYGINPADDQLYQRHALYTVKERLDYVDDSNQDNIPARMQEFFDRRPKGQPYFLQVNLNDPHLAWNTGKHPPDPAAVRVPKFLPDIPEVRKDLSLYMGECEHADELARTIREIVKKRAGLENTLILYFGDNGMAFPNGKGSLNDPGLNVPLLAWWPGVVKPGTESRALISGEDIAPTCLEAAGVTPPDSMSGVSFLPLLRGQPFPREREYLFAARAAHDVKPYGGKTAAGGPIDYSRCVRDARYKLIMNLTPERRYAPAQWDVNFCPHWKAMVKLHEEKKLAPEIEAKYFGPRPGFELYDLQSDPDELHNLYGRKELAPVEQKLKRALRDKMILDYDDLPLP